VSSALMMMESFGSDEPALPGKDLVMVAHSGGNGAGQQRHRAGTASSRNGVKQERHQARTALS
jgi:hypothetical protein